MNFIFHILGEDQQNVEKHDEKSLWTSTISEFLIDHGYLLDGTDVIIKFLAICKKFDKPEEVIGAQFKKFADANSIEYVDLALVQDFETSLIKGNKAKTDVAAKTTKTTNEKQVI